MFLMIIGVIFALLGICIVLRGKIPFVSRYNGVKEGKEVLHCRIEGGALMLVGIIMISTYILNLDSAMMVISMLVTCILAFTLEIGFKVIK